MSDQNSKVIFVDFKQRCVTKVEEIVGGVKSTTAVTKKVAPSFDLPPSIPDGEFILNTDPARYIEQAVENFENVCDQQGLFDPHKYKNPQVLHDAMETYSLLQREIPMLKDTMENIRDMIRIQTGSDPSMKNRIPKKGS